MSRYTTEERGAKLPENSDVRKSMPIFSGVVNYFPLALAYVAMISKCGSEKHNPGLPLHWDKTKSTDHLDCVARHLVDHDKLSDDNLLHAGNLAWRGLANLQQFLEELIAKGYDPFAPDFPEKYVGGKALGETGMPDGLCKPEDFPNDDWKGHEHL